MTSRQVRSWVRTALRPRLLWLALLAAGCAHTRGSREGPPLAMHQEESAAAQPSPVSPATTVHHPEIDASRVITTHYEGTYEPTAGAEDLPRQRMPISGTSTTGGPAGQGGASAARGLVQPVQYTSPPATGVPGYPDTGRAFGGPSTPPPPPSATSMAPSGTPFPAPPATPAPPGWPAASAPLGPPAVVGGIPDPALSGSASFPQPLFGPNDRFADVIVNLQEAQTGRLMIGAAVNSDAGVTGQIIIDERNFDWRQVPMSWDDVWSGRAFRGGGQSFRVEALPGNQFQRYSVSFAEPFFLNTRVSLDLSGYLFDRNYFDWDEGRFGGRVGLGYRLTPDLSISTQFRGEEVEISDPRVPGVAELDAALGKNDIYGTRFAVAHDTRDLPFAPTQGRFLELSFEQVFGSFDYPRGMIDWRRYFLVTERMDGSGRHVLGFSSRIGVTGSQTPIFENFFAGGYSTLRGFNFRGAAPQDSGVTVGGELLLLGSVEYLFPVTADDMLKGVVFVDYGTVEEEIEFNADDYRVALGAGVRINIPAMGPAPIAIDFAVPVAREDTDNIQNISFFMGINR